MSNCKTRFGHVLCQNVVIIEMCEEWMKVAKEESRMWERKEKAKWGSGESCCDTVGSGSSGMRSPISTACWSHCFLLPLLLLFLLLVFKFSPHLRFLFFFYAHISPHSIYIISRILHDFTSHFLDIFFFLCSHLTSFGSLKIAWFLVFSDCTIKQNISFHFTFAVLILPTLWKCYFSNVH